MKIRHSVASLRGANRGLGLVLGRHARYWACVPLFALIITSTFAQTAQQHRTSPLMDRDLEIARALSAAPPEVRPHAGVYILEQHGFVKVRESQNGFNCIIERRANHTAPMCYDAEGSNSTLQATLKRGELLMQGVGPSEIEKRIDKD